MSPPDDPPGVQMEVELCWVTVDTDTSSRVCSERLLLPVGASVAEALAALGRAELSAQLAEGVLAVALFGETVPHDRVLHPGDRIELLGPLLADPKLSRARRAEVQRQRRGDARWQRR